MRAHPIGPPSKSASDHVCGILVWVLLLTVLRMRNELAGADRGGWAGPGSPLTLGFEVPKLSIFGPYLIFQ